MRPFRIGSGTTGLTPFRPTKEPRFIGDPRPSAARPLLGLSFVSLICVLILLVLHVVSWIGRPRPPKGLMIRVLRPGISASPSPGIQPLIVRVGKDARGDVTFLLNSQPISEQDLTAALRREIYQRPPDWPVYVEGDPDLQAQYVVDVIDIVQGVHRRVVLLTPSSAVSKPAPPK